MRLKARFYDQFLVIDGKRIDFLAHLPENTWNVFVKEVPESSGHGMGIQYTYECKSRFMERNFYIACHEIVYSHNDPDEVFYYDYLRMELNGNAGGWNDADGYGHSMSSGRHPEAVFIIYANHQPIISTDCNWMTVEKSNREKKRAIQRQPRHCIPMEDKHPNSRKHYQYGPYCPPIPERHERKCDADLYNYPARRRV